MFQEFLCLKRTQVQVKVHSGFPHSPWELGWLSVPSPNTGSHSREEWLTAPSEPGSPDTMTRRVAKPGFGLRTDLAQLVQLMAKGT